MARSARKAEKQDFCLMSFFSTWLNLKIFLLSFKHTRVCVFFIVFIEIYKSDRQVLTAFIIKKVEKEHLHLVVVDFNLVKSQPFQIIVFCCCKRVQNKIDLISNQTY
jgi:hypothetical protein